ncbi:hypothetical protein RB595_010240 [Gaeumannomyces hyphopodioides]
MPPPPNMGGHMGPSNIDKLKMGAMMGGTVGAIMGFIWGTVTVFRFGAGTNGVMRTIGQYMLASGTTFGYALPNLAPPGSMTRPSRPPLTFGHRKNSFFMGIGSVIRSDSSPILQQAYAQAYRRPTIMAQQRAFRPRPRDD